jgi:hypothetical protein
VQACTATYTALYFYYYSAQAVRASSSEGFSFANSASLKTLHRRLAGSSFGLRVGAHSQI